MKMLRAGIFQIDEVLPYVVLQMPEHGREKVKSRPQRIYNGKTVHMDSLRYQTFIKSGTVCVACGLEGEYFALEHQPNNGSDDRYHMNLYGTKDGREVLFTKDHIVPRKHGGPNFLFNLQTMCQPCNTHKGSDDEDTITYKHSRSRIKRLIWKMQEALRLSKQAKPHYEAGTSDGGPAFVAHKKRHQQLQKRARFFRERDVALQQTRQQGKHQKKEEFKKQLEQLRAQQEQRRQQLDNG